MRRFNVTSSLAALSRMIAAGLLFAVAIALSVTPLLAQVDTGSITGTVTDPSGAVVGNAKVTLTNEGTGQSLTTTTGSDGLYNFTPLESAATPFRRPRQASRRRRNERSCER